MTPEAEISAAVEGDLDEVVVRRILAEHQLDLARTFVQRGKANLRQHLSRYNRAAAYSPWIVVADLDNAPCAPTLLQDWLPSPTAKMCFRVAVRSIETWLLADRRSIAHFLDVSESLVPRDPESESNPKNTMIQIARRSKRRDIREGLVPRPESGRKIGASYSAHLIEFTEKRWSPLRAAQRSDSLRRALNRVGHLAKTGSWR